jgi:pimeloyl-ACP methyl ester carboxylesterase
MSGWRVERVKDLTTRGQGVHPDAVAVAPAGWPPPKRAVRGRQLRGQLPGQGAFVLRIPDDWNGRLVAAGTPGTRTEYAGDLIFSDFVLPRGYAYLAGDKGGTGGGMVAGARPVVPSREHPYGLDFALLRPSVTIEGWTTSLVALTGFAHEQLRLAHGRGPERTYLIGISNGGYQVRRALETAPELYDGGVDWEGVHWTAAGPSLFTYLPVAVRNYPIFADPRAGRTERERARQAILAAGFPPGSEVLWEIHNRIYWGLTQWLYARKLDPAYLGEPANYDLASRPPEVLDRIRALTTTGAIGRPLLSLHGTLDCLLPPGVHAVPYAEAVRARERADLHRLYLVERGNHIDNFAAQVPAAHLEIMLPHVRHAFDLLVSWVERGLEPPPSQTISVGGQL